MNNLFRQSKCFESFSFSLRLGLLSKLYWCAASGDKCFWNADLFMLFTLGYVWSGSSMLSFGCIWSFFCIFNGSLSVRGGFTVWWLEEYLLRKLISRGAPTSRVRGYWEAPEDEPGRLRSLARFYLSLLILLFVRKPGISTSWLLLFATTSSNITTGFSSFTYSLSASTTVYLDFASSEV